mgnify:CR=1 FL=1
MATAKRVMAVKEPSVANAYERKVERMLNGNAAHQKKQAAKLEVGRKAPMATKVDRRRSSAAKAKRVVTLKQHFKAVLSGKSGRMQGKK